ncbi:EYxxD motif small membrane protein [Bacillus sp. Hm123]|uniref:EYxxD motif small membrane protein n=1 Tax=Bacillus sp. Hm123 TaxID=3450745 RepID=UPI003F4433F5
MTEWRSSAMQSGWHLTRVSRRRSWTLEKRKTPFSDVWTGMILSSQKRGCLRDSLPKKELKTMFMEYMTDMSFIIAIIIGSVIATLFVYVRRSKRRAQ